MVLYARKNEEIIRVSPEIAGLDLALSLVAVSAEAGDIPGVFGALIRSRTLVLDEAIARSRKLGGAAGGERDNLQREVAEAAKATSSEAFQPVYTREAAYAIPLAWFAAFTPADHVASQHSGQEIHRFIAPADAAAQHLEKLA